MEKELLRYLLLLPLLGLCPEGYRTYTVEEECGTGNLSVRLESTGTGSAALLRATERTSYILTMDCRILIQAPAAHLIVVSVRQIGFRLNPLRTCKDYLQIDRQMCTPLFFENEGLHFLSNSSKKELLYHVGQEGMDNITFTGHPGFEVVVTSFTTGQACDEDEHRCENGHCIWSGLTCDSHNNCGDLSDERECDSGGGGSSSTALIILGVLILLLLLIMCIATLLCSKNENVRRFSNRLRSRTISYMTRRSR